MSAAPQAARAARWDTPSANLRRARLADLRYGSRSVRGTQCRSEPSRAADTPFAALQESYRSDGGIVSAENLAQLMQDAGVGDHVLLARKIVSRELLSFQWNHSFWLPAFQFEGDRFAPAAGPRAICQELERVFDGWDITQWFATPNPWLQDEPPLQALKTRLPAVLDAARADRFVEAG